MVRKSNLDIASHHGIDVLLIHAVHSFSGNIFLIKKVTEEPSSVMHVPAAKSFKFKLKACDSAYVTLLQTPDTSSAGYYLEIGTNANSLTRLYRSNNGTFENVAEEFTLFILECDFFNEFWITFDVNGTVSFGKGPEISTPLLSYEDDKPHPVHGITFSSDEFDFVPAEFEFSRSSGINICFP